ncbi:MAG TPA: histidine--tRNA ligase [Candidatus Binatus sp.]|jgi:histidyl-tRNA synthetase|nr:histidine--tRNA ligase [Candidatus Binatus sp.]
MANKSKFQAIRGTRDLLPPETALWNRVEQTAHEVFSTFGFGEIRPPIFEETELFGRAVGGDTDIVSKEMYRFDLYDSGSIRHWRNEVLHSVIPAQHLQRLKSFIESAESLWESGRIDNTDSNKRALSELKEVRSQLESQNPDPTQSASLLARSAAAVIQLDIGQEVVLRPEATASVCRAYIEHNIQQLPQPVKLYYMGPMFRRERPQKGRYRQFYQIGAEILGGPDAPAIDAELIEMLMTFFDKCGLQGTELSINSIGHAADNCRRGYVAKLREELLKVKDKLGADSQRRIETNPLRVLDSKLEHEQAIIATLPHIADHLCDECKTHYAAVKHELELRGVIYRENWRLVRGLDYYMRTTFEITAQGLGSQNAVCGGGRYDGLVELLGGPPTKGIGFAIGEDRLILSLQESGKGAAPQGRDVYIAWMGERAYATAIRAAKDLRNAGFRVELPPTELKFGKALERASKLGSRFALILGDNEVQSGEWTLKNLATSEQQKLTEQALLEYLHGL